MSIGKMWLSAVLAENSVAAFLQHGKIEHLFKGTEVEVYEFVRDFVKQYQALPTEETIEKHTGEKLVPHTEPSGYYFDLMEARHIELSLKRTMKEVSNLLLPENKDPHEALGLIADAAMQLIAQKHSKQIVDFRDAYGLLMKTYASKFNAMDEYGLQLGWPTLDKMSGGLVRGDVLRDDLVDDAEAVKVGRGDPHRLGGLLRFASILPEDGGAGLGRSHGVDRVLQHQDAVGDADGERAAAAALADHDRDDGNAQPGHG